MRWRESCALSAYGALRQSHDRPTMSEVVEKLEDDVDGLQMPPSRPLFCDEEDISVTGSCQYYSELTDG